MNIVQHKSFTFIEMLVVISVMLIIVPTVFTIVFSILKVQSKMYRLTTSKREGDYLLNIMTTTIRNRAVSIHESYPPNDTNRICSNSTNISLDKDYIYFKDIEGNWFGYTLFNNSIGSSSSFLSLTPTGTITPTPTSVLSPTPSATQPPINLNSINTYVQNLKLGCEVLAGYTYPTVLISFEICYKSSEGNCYTPNSEEISLLHYQTGVRLRNSD